MKVLASVFVVAFGIHASFAQVGGGSVFRQGQSGSNAAQVNERAKRSVSKDEMPPSPNSMFVDASVLINVPADEYVAVFAISQEGATLAECNQKMSETIGQFQSEISGLGVPTKDVYIDFVAQNRIYGFEIKGDVAVEKLVGFEVKKNAAVHYKNKEMLDKLLSSAAKAGIFDLVKVDYVVRNTAAIHNKLMEAAVGIVKRKAANHAKLLGTKLIGPAQVFAEKYSSYFPTEMYDTYTAYEAEDISGSYYRQKFVVQGARRNRTFFFQPLNAETFDQVVNPVVIEPVVQFTLYLKVKYLTSASPAPAERIPKRT
jgi:uncharacterized protein YggE